MSYVYSELFTERYTYLREAGFTPFGDNGMLFEANSDKNRWIIDIRWSFEKIKESVKEWGIMK